MNRRGTHTLIFICLMALLVSFGAYAEVGGQIVGFTAAPLVNDPDSFNELTREYERTNDEDLFGGLEGEIWFDQLGVGLRHAGRFHAQTVEVHNENVDPVTISEKDAWWYDGRSDLFVAYHLFGGGSFIDPYIRYGAGVASRVNINTSFGYDEDREIWTTAEAVEDEDDCEDPEERCSYDHLGGVGMYQYLGAGVQLNLGGLVLGGGVNYNIIHQQITTGAYEPDLFPSTRFEARLYGGIAF